MTLLISLLFSLYSISSFSLEIIQIEGSYKLKASCEEAAKEISQFSDKRASCQCEKESCLTDLNPHLDQRILNTFEQPQLQESIIEKPNCFGSVLYAVGAANSIQYNNMDIQVWQSSPLCRRIDMPPQAKDIVQIHYLSELEKSEDGSPIYKHHFTGDAHSYLALSSTLAFNKSSPDPQDLFELIKVRDYLDLDNDYQSRLPDECRFVNPTMARSRKCEFFSTSYRCDFQKLSSSVPTSLNLKKAMQNRKNLCLKNLELLKQRAPVDSLFVELEGLKTEARKALGILPFKELPSRLQKLILDYSPVNQTQGPWLENWVETVVMMASPDMDLSRTPFLSEAALAARELNIYPKGDPMERLNWFKILTSSISAHEKQGLICD